MTEKHRLEQGERLKEIRKYLGLNQIEMAKVLNITQPYLSRLERGDYTVSTEILFDIISMRKDISVNWFLTGEGDMVMRQQSDLSIAADPGVEYQKKVLDIERFLKDHFPDFN